MSAEDIDRAGIDAGTVSYMSPEQARATRWTPSDLFSLGTVIYEMAAGVPGVRRQLTRAVIGRF